MLKNGAYLINAAQVKQLEDVVLVWSKPKKEGEQPKRVINKDWVGRDAKKILAQIGINVGDDIRCIICETEFSQVICSNRTYDADTSYRQSRYIRRGC